MMLTTGQRRQTRVAFPPGTRGPQEPEARVLPAIRLCTPGVTPKHQLLADGRFPNTANSVLSSPICSAGLEKFKNTDSY